eukprot:2678730-Karenia_brevis.AAC.1
MVVWGLANRSALAMQFTPGAVGPSLVSNPLPFSSMVGKPVIVQGLVSKPELNGRRAELVAFDVDTFRYTVKFGSGVEHFKVKPNNLHYPPLADLQHAFVPKFPQ